MRVLVDANIRHAAAGAYLHINDELMMWGPRLIATRRFEYRFRPPSKRTNQLETRYIPALAKLGSERGVEFVTYWLLEYELWQMPAPYDWVGRSIVDLFKPSHLPWREPAYSGLVAGAGGFDLKAAIQQFILSVEDVRFREILEAFGLENSQDAFHVWTCERNGIDCIVELDGPFRAKLRQVRKLLSLKVNAYPPSEICKRLKIDPIEPGWFEEFDEFRNTRLITLFDRKATLRDRIIYKVYRRCVGLGKRFGYPIDFVIPGYEHSYQRAPAHLRR